MKREIQEEVNVKVEVNGLLGIHIQVVKDVQLVCFYFKAKIVDGEVGKSKEVKDYRWLSIEELGQLPKNLLRPPYSLFRKILDSLKMNKTARDIFTY